MEKKYFDVADEILKQYLEEQPVSLSIFGVFGNPLVGCVVRLLKIKGIEPTEELIYQGILNIEIDMCNYINSLNIFEKPLTVSDITIKNKTLMEFANKPDSPLVIQWAARAFYNDVRLIQAWKEVARQKVTSFQKPQEQQSNGLQSCP